MTDRQADAIERIAGLHERDERRRRREELEVKWGRSAPPRLDMTGYFRLIPGLAAQFARIVPDAHVRRGDSVSVVCPCGAAPATPYAELVSCECGRWFLFDGHDVRVASFPREEAQLEAAG